MNSFKDASLSRAARSGWNDSRPLAPKSRAGFPRRRQVAMVLLAVLSVPVSALAHEYSSGEIEVVHPYAPPTPPGAAMAAGYLDIINHGDSDDRLIGGKVYFAHELQMHETVVENDVSRMREAADGILIPAGETVSMAPMGRHLMFVELAEPLVEGGTHEATLTFEKAGEIEVVFNVEYPQAGDMNHEGMDHEQMNHGEMDHGDMEHDDMAHEDMSQDATENKADEHKHH